MKFMSDFLLFIISLQHFNNHIYLVNMIVFIFKEENGLYKAI